MVKKKTTFKELDTRKGRLSNREKEIIRKYAPTKTHEWIAATINRTPDSVRDFCLLESLNSSPEEEEVAAINYDLKTKPFWRELKQQFTERELEMIVYHWTEIIKQFKQDITATEELQVLDLIQIKILVHRNLKSRNEIHVQSEQIKKMIDGVYGNSKGRDLDADEKKYLTGLMTELNNIQSMDTAKSKEHREYLATEEKLHRELKVTRNQRIDRLEDSKTNILDWLKELQEMDVRDKEGKELLLLREAVVQDKNRLSEYHTYMDGMVDQPIFNSETVRGDKIEHQDSKE